MNVYTLLKELVILEDEAFSSGGEGEVRKVKYAPSRFPAESCVKIYYQNKRTDSQRRKIQYMADNPPEKVSGIGFMIGWPLTQIVEEKGAFLGFLMPLAFPDSKQLVCLTATNLSKKLGPEWYRKYDRANGKYALISRLKLINNIAIPIHLLHSTDRYVLKDFKPQNVLVTHSGKVTLVDMDSVQICDSGRLVFPGTAATDLYMPEEYYKYGVGTDLSEPLKTSWDSFALGVVFYQILFGLHPYTVTPWHQKDTDSQEITANIAAGLFPFGTHKNDVRSFPYPHKKFSILPQKVQSMFLSTFSDNAGSRPSASEWGQTIHDILKSTPAVTPPPMPKPKPKTQTSAGQKSGPRPLTGPGSGSNTTSGTTSGSGLGSNSNPPSPKEDSPSYLLNFFSFMIPLLGWVVAASISSGRPVRAKSCRKSAWIGFLTWIVTGIIASS